MSRRSGTKTGRAGWGGAEAEEAAVEAELSARVLADARLTLALHPVVAVLVGILFWPEGWTRDTSLLVGLVVVGAAVRWVFVGRAGRREDAAGRFRLAGLGALATALAWGGGAFLLRQSPLGAANGYEGMLFAGLVAAGVATQAADRQGFHLFTGTLLLSLIGAAWLIEPTPNVVRVTVLVVVFWGVVAVLHAESHRSLVGATGTALRLRRAEADMAHRRRYLDALLQSVPHAMLVLDADGKVFRASAEFERIFGVRESAIEGLPAAALGDRGAALGALAELVKRLPAGAEPEEVEIPDASGRRRTLRVAVRRGADAADGALSVAVEDVTTLRTAERARGEAERQYREILDTGLDLVWRIDADGRWSFVNDTATRAIYGMPASELIGQHFLDITNPDHARKDLDAFARLLNGGELVDYETAHVRADGSTVWLSFTARPILDAAERVIAVQGTAREVTERVEHRVALEKLIEQDALIRALLNGSPDLIALKDASGVYRGVNHAMEKLLGRRESEVIGRHDSQLYPDEAARQIVETDQQAYWERRSVSFEHWMDLPSAGRRRFHVVKTPQFDPQGRPVGLITIARDVTEIYEARERAEELAREAEHANRMKSAFLANVSHEIRTPMNGVLGMTEILLDTPLTAEQRQAAETVQTSAEALLALLNDILDVSKIEAGHLELETVPFDLVETVTQATRTLAPAASRRGTELTVDAGGDLPGAVVGDPMRLRQVLVNLVGNAVKFTESGEIVVTASAARLEEKRAHVRFSVRDTGCGIESSRLERIFEAFAQADASTARTHGGTGLGLTISRQLVRMMGGELEVRSERGAGSEFFFTLPLEVTDQGAGRAPGEIPSLVDVRVLVVDDNPINRRVMRGVMERASAHVDEAEDALEALARLRASADEGRGYDVVLLDDRIGNGRGVDVLAAMKADPSIAAVPALLLSSGSHPAEAQRARRLGVGGLLSKPVNRHDLLMAVWHLVRTEPPTEAVAEAAPAEASPGRALSILIAEDNRVNQQVARALLEKRGHRVDVAENGREAVALAGRRAYDLIFMDLRMPEMDGFEATARLRSARATADLPIVALTAHALPEERERCLAAGMNDFLSKPFRPIELFAMVERWVEGGAAGEASVPGGNGRHAPDSVAPPVDIDGFRTAMREVGVESVVDTALALFVRDAPARMKMLDTALEQGDARAIDSAAHAFKSGAGSIHARGLAGLLAEVEARAEAGDVHGARALAGDLRATYDAVMEQLGREATVE